MFAVNIRKAPDRRFLKENESLKRSTIRTGIPVIEQGARKPCVIFHDLKLTDGESALAVVPSEKWRWIVALTTEEGHQYVLGNHDVFSSTIETLKHLAA